MDTQICQPRRYLRNLSTHIRGSATYSWTTIKAPWVPGIYLILHRNLFIGGPPNYLAASFMCSSLQWNVQQNVIYFPYMLSGLLNGIVLIPLLLYTVIYYCNFILNILFVYNVFYWPPTFIFNKWWHLVRAIFICMEELQRLCKELWYTTWWHATRHIYSYVKYGISKVREYCGQWPVCYGANAAGSAESTCMMIPRSLMQAYTTEQHRTYNQLQ